MMSSIFSYYPTTSGFVKALASYNKGRFLSFGRGSFIGSVLFP